MGSAGRAVLCFLNAFYYHRLFVPSLQTRYCFLHDWLKRDRRPGLPIALHILQYPPSYAIMPVPLDNPKEYQQIFHWAETQKDGTIPSFATRKNDPYEVSPLSGTQLLHC